MPEPDDAAEDVVGVNDILYGFAVRPVILTCRIFPGWRLCRRYDGCAVHTVKFVPQTKSPFSQPDRNW